MNNQNNLPKPKTKNFFLALLPPAEVESFAQKLKEDFAKNYHTRAALKSPAHITLQPPFAWEIERLPELKAKIQNFVSNQSSVPIIIDGYGAFGNRVIYLNVLKTPEIINLQEQLKTYFQKNLDITDKSPKNRDFTPHMTVAFRDLTKHNFEQAWVMLASEKVNFDFTVPELTLLMHNGKIWKIKDTFPFGN
ncbi:MAG: 2'-5' RNA ligase family protein [Cyanobacteria bacterium J083]|nr:MAG: 2'-5' RNA ligase family protein [Cyanobacteria bacterium J083]